MSDSTTITVRKLPDEVARAVRARARRDRTSLSRAATSLLAEATGTLPVAPLGVLDDPVVAALFGSSSAAEADALDAALAELRSVDPEDWR